MSLMNPNLYKHFPFFKQKLANCTETAQFLFSFFRKQIEEHKKEFREEEEPRDYVSA
jgi:uncharacterized membrane-anchored protein YhcB (DUF1043 family)